MTDFVPEMLPPGERAAAFGEAMTRPRGRMKRRSRGRMRRIRGRKRSGPEPEWLEVECWSSP